ncbi:chondroitin proteoglycan 2-like [Chenopodium quinoa]|uniref:chondroitin proteoglycan 2-like n=1 Tax=Chenopodium quinoa TaxID=63459 RepID=UPI000B7943F9|nr:chondroitin proteoglycan 2-like [Chenopodium quinoa]
MARIRVTAIYPDYQSVDPAVDPADPINQEQAEEPAEMGPNEEVLQNSPSTPSTPGDSILDNSGSNAEESGEGSGEESGEKSGERSGEGSGEQSGEGSADNGESGPGPNEESSEEAAPIEEEAYNWSAKGDPTDMTMFARDVVTLNATLPAFLQKKPVGEGWEAVVPPVEARVVWTDDVDHADNFFGCYEAAFTAG